jgi:uracil-DNA glycosylase
MDTDISERLRDRLRKPPSSCAVRESLPVLFFGDIFSAEIATVGLNPSNREYVDQHGELLSGSGQRFATLHSLGAVDRASLTDAQCDEATRWMQGYFDAGKPVYGWFTGLERVARGFGASLAERSAVHLDLVQEPTHPTWSALPRDERDRLLDRDLQFLAWQIRRFPFRAVICSGKTASVHVRRALGVTVEETGRMARIEWWCGSALLTRRRVGFAGWNYPLARPTGLGADGERRLGALLSARLVEL